MEARKLKTVDDLMEHPDERVELIDGEIVRRPMARADHALAQLAISDEIQPLKRCAGPGGWWIMSEVSVRYGEHQCPAHDLAGWRKERVPERPTGIMTLAPDWVCEILSPGHEGKDTVHHLILLQRAQVPHYWILSPENRSLIAYALESGSYRICFSAEERDGAFLGKVRIPPFDTIEIDLDYVFGGVD